MSGINFSDATAIGTIGSVDIESSTNGEVHYQIVNKSVGTAATTAFVLIEDKNDVNKFSHFAHFNSGYVGTTYTQPNSALLRSGGANGLVLQASNVSGSIKFVAGGLNDASALRMTIQNDGRVTLAYDDAYGVGWNGSLDLPTKNAIYDKIESLAGDIPTTAEITALIYSILETEGLISASFMLLETGDRLLLETGDGLLLG